MTPNSSDVPDKNGRIIQLGDRVTVGSLTMPVVWYRGAFCLERYRNDFVPLLRYRSEEMEVVNSDDSI